MGLADARLIKKQISSSQARPQYVLKDKKSGAPTVSF